MNCTDSSDHSEGLPWVDCDDSRQPKLCAWYDPQPKPDEDDAGQDQPGRSEAKKRKCIRSQRRGMLRYPQTPWDRVSARWLAKAAICFAHHRKFPLDLCRF